MCIFLFAVFKVVFPPLQNIQKRTYVNALKMFFSYQRQRVTQLIGKLKTFPSTFQRKTKPFQTVSGVKF
jgi:hypothetical protein